MLRRERIRRLRRKGIVERRILAVSLRLSGGKTPITESSIVMVPRLVSPHPDCRRRINLATLV
jgi:hypothetical protein